MNSYRSPKQCRILKQFHFTVWPIAKFGPFPLWLITSRLAGVNQQPPMQTRPFQPFCEWTKNPSSSVAQGFSSPLLCPKIFPSCLTPLLPLSPHFPLTPSRELSRAYELQPKGFVTHSLRIVESSTLQECVEISHSLHLESLVELMSFSHRASWHIAWG